MKSIFLAAAALIAMPAIAQDMPPADPATAPQDQTMTPADSAAPAPAGDPADKHYGGSWFA